MMKTHRVENIAFYDLFFMFITDIISYVPSIRSYGYHQDRTDLEIFLCNAPLLVMELALEKAHVQILHCPFSVKRLYLCCFWRPFCPNRTISKSPHCSIVCSNFPQILNIIFTKTKLYMIYIKSGGTLEHTKNFTKYYLSFFFHLLIIIGQLFSL